MFHDIIILGGGASGIMASLIAKDMGHDVAIIEHKDRIAKKILVTGNGRCNISNSNMMTNYFHSSSSVEVIDSVLSNFGLSESLNFFKSIGINTLELENGKLFPMSLQASSVVDIFLKSIEDKGIPIYTSTKINSISKSKAGFELSNKDQTFNCNKLILATGGSSYTKTGSDGSGFSIARNLGHSIIPIKPAIVQLKLDFEKLKALSGVKFNGKANVILDGKVIRSEYGEILFTDYGISGPPILQLSRVVSHNPSAYIEVDMFPHLSKPELEDFLESHWGIVGYRSVHDSLIGIVNKKLIPTILKYSGLKNIHKSCWELTYKEKQTILLLLKGWKFKTSGTKGFESAQVTCGGINLTEVNSSTLESTIVKNLYFCGEVLDVDGDCGGYNLQWAWSSGAIAGMSASK